MSRSNCTFLLALTLCAAPTLQAQATEASITNQLKNLRSVATPERPAATMKIAMDIRTLPQGLRKLQLADGLSHLATEGDAGQDTLQAVAQTLSQALSENPLPAKGEQPPMP